MEGKNYLLFYGTKREGEKREREVELLEPCSTFFRVFRLNTAECAPKSFQQFFNQLLCVEQVGRKIEGKMRSAAQRILISEV